MNLYLDGMFYRCTGVGRLYENLLSGLLEHGGGERIHTLVPDVHREAFLAQFDSPAIRPVFVRYGPMSLSDLLLKGEDLRRAAPDVSLFYFPGHNVPLSVPGRYIVGVNDVTVFSEHFHLPRYRKAAFRWLLARAVRRAEAVVTISETAKRDIVREFGIPPEKVQVVYPWVEEKFFPGSAGEPPGPSPVAGEYILFVGLRIAHKNLEGLIRAFLLVATEVPDLRLVIAGSRYRSPDMVDRWKADLRLAGRLVEFPDVTDDDLRRLYAGARAFVFPSLAEGFGLPPLEAMASGVPVVCSDIPVFREVYGEAVCYVDPRHPESIANGIRRVLTDPDFSFGLSRKGGERAARYRRERSLKEHLESIRILSGMPQGSR